MKQNKAHLLWTHIKQSFQYYVEIFSVFIQSEKGKLIGKIAGYLVQISIVGYLLYQLSKIGWSTLLNSLPVVPLFYIFFLIIYFALPTSEIIAYKQSWPIRFLKSLPVFIKKRVFNKMLIGYSGELLAFNWAKSKNFDTDKEIFKVIRDNNIVSSISSTSVAFILLLIFIVTGQVILPDFTPDRSQITKIGIGLFIAAILLIVAYLNREYLFSMSKKVALSVFGIHTTRLIIITIVQILQWHVVLPDTPYKIWFTFLSLQIIINRIPFLPNRDLVFIGTGLEMSGYLNIPAAELSGMLIMQGALEKIMNVILYLAILFKERGEKKVVQEIHESQDINELID